MAEEREMYTPPTTADDDGGQRRAEEYVDSRPELEEKVALLLKDAFGQLQAGGQVTFEGIARTALSAIDQERDGELERLEEANKRLQGAWFDRGIELERLRATLKQIDVLPDMWDAPISTNDVEASNRAWAAVGSEAHAIAHRTLASRPSTETKE